MRICKSHARTVALVAQKNHRMENDRSIHSWFDLYLSVFSRTSPIDRFVYRHPVDNVKKQLFVTPYEKRGQYTLKFVNFEQRMLIGLKMSPANLTRMMCRLSTFSNKFPRYK